MKPFQIRGSFDNVQNDVTMFFDPVDELITVAAISPNSLQSVQHGREELEERKHAAILILDAGGVHNDFE